MVFATFLIAIAIICCAIGYYIAKCLCTISFWRILAWIFVFFVVSIVIFFIVALFAGLFFLL